MNGYLELKRCRSKTRLKSRGLPEHVAIFDDTQYGPHVTNLMQHLPGVIATLRVGTCGGATPCSAASTWRRPQEQHGSTYEQIVSPSLLAAAKSLVSRRGHISAREDSAPRKREKAIKWTCNKKTTDSQLLTASCVRVCASTTIGRATPGLRLTPAAAAAAAVVPTFIYKGKLQPGSGKSPEKEANSGKHGTRGVKPLHPTTSRKKFEKPRSPSPVFRAL
jgi:hypothetical protein